MPDARELIATRIRQRVRVRLDAEESSTPFARDFEIPDDKKLLHATADTLDVDLTSQRTDRRGRTITWLRRHLKSLIYPLLQTQMTHNQVGTRMTTYLLEQHEAQGWLVARLEGQVERATAMLQQLDSRTELLERESASAARLIGRAALQDRTGPSLEAVAAALRPVAALLAPCDGPIADLGCGRGELLGLLADAGRVDAYGIDLDLGMVSRCHERGLLVHREDALAHLRDLDDRSLGAVAAGGMAEEWPLVRLVTLLRLARRRLRKGAPLVLHGPNTDHPEGQAALRDDPLILRGHGALGIAAILEQEGFADVRIDDGGPRYFVWGTVT
jgi:SAM-dependent methyltransferase